MATSLYERLREWMRGNDITYASLGQELGVSGAYASRICRAQHIPVRHHARMVELGFPPELLPPAEDRKRGKRALTPRWPGKVENVSAAGE